MRLTVVGSGDAWGSTGRFHTCFRLDAGGRTLLVDFGAAAIVAWHKMGFSLVDVDAVVISHLHGDHFGGLPFLLLDSQFDTKRTRPLTIVGPPGLTNRLNQAIEVFFPGVAARGWRFPWRVEEVAPGGSTEVAGFAYASAPVIHGTFVSATAMRLTHGDRVFGYSGDTEWTDALLPIAAGADFFIVECHDAEHAAPGHLDWPRLRANLPRLDAKRIAVTHMSAAARAQADTMRAAGLIVLDDGQVFDV